MSTTPAHFFNIATDQLQDMINKNIIFLTADKNTKEPLAFDSDIVQNIIQITTDTIYEGLIQHINEHLKIEEKIEEAPVDFPEETSLE